MREGAAIGTRRRSRGKPAHPHAAGDFRESLKEGEEKGGENYPWITLPGPGGQKREKDNFFRSSINFSGLFARLLRPYLVPESRVLLLQRRHRSPFVLGGGGLVDSRPRSPVNHTYAASGVKIASSLVQ